MEKGVYKEVVKKFFKRKTFKWQIKNKLVYIKMVDDWRDHTLRKFY